MFGNKNTKETLPPIQMWIQASGFIKEMGVKSIKITFPCKPGESYEDCHTRFSAIITNEVLWKMWDEAIITNSVNSQVLSNAFDIAGIKGYKIEILDENDSGWIDTLMENNITSS